jgi:diguanylate cyclase (GGDEF)-like protein
MDSAGRRIGLDWASVILGAFIGVAGVFGLTSLALYPLMRRSFTVWNFGRTLGFCLIAFAILPSAPTTWLYQYISEIGVAISTACSGPFLASYFERGLGLQRVRRWLRAVGVIGLAAAGGTLFAASLPVLSVVRDVLLLLAIVIVVAGLASAIRRGSRAARYQAVAWGPLIAVGVAELSYEFVTGREYWLWPLAVLIAVVIDFIVTSLGLVDGFLIIKRERDTAIADVREATLASTLDPLTGIANRRGLAQRFGDSASGRPLGIAVIDCDHFKRINDNFGHAVGDEALVAVAQALEGDELFIGRLGGEEFVALIYGENWQELAEQARLRIDMGVRRRAPQLGFRVTASAGLAEVRDSDTLESAIKRADRALYAAKDAGRDRSLFLDEPGPGEARLAQVL